MARDNHYYIRRVPSDTHTHTYTQTRRCAHQPHRKYWKFMRSSPPEILPSAPTTTGLKPHLFAWGEILSLNFFLLFFVASLEAKTIFSLFNFYDLIYTSSSYPIYVCVCAFNLRIWPRKLIRAIYFLLLIFYYCISLTN